MGSLMPVWQGAVIWASWGVWFAVAGHSHLRATRGCSRQAVSTTPGAHASVRTAGLS